MRKSLFVLFVIFSTTYAIAQLPPTNMYENLKIYESNSLYVNGEKVAFDGKDYLYLDYESDDLYFLFPTEYGWEKESANYCCCGHIEISTQRRKNILCCGICW